MATTATRDQNRSIPARLTDVPFALFGAGDAAIEQARAVPERVERVRGELGSLPGRIVQQFDELAARGRTLSNRIDRDPKVKDARAQTRSARSKVKGATTSVGRAAEAQVAAAGSAARKAG